MATVLVIEDDEDTRAYLTQLLKTYGWDVVDAPSGRAGLVAYQDRRPDLVLLDLGLPDLSGLQVIEQLRSAGDTPVIFLSGTSRHVSRIDALDAGADDFITKPFRAAELAARVRAVVRRSEAVAPGVTERHFGELSIDTASMTVRRAGHEVRLTPLEWRLLEAVSRRPGRVVTHRWLAHQIWSTDHGPEVNGALRAHVRSLRHKLGDDATDSHLLRTESGIGYRWIAESDADSPHPQVTTPDRDGEASPADDAPAPDASSLVSLAERVLEVVRTEQLGGSARGQLADLLQQAWAVASNLECREGDGPTIV
ncbi:response regulator transcription factor [Nocardioides rubriscoriae]|uniref:response regulator transcription factor n=1 Tax=Nocardioides rubriscoriae TaxID=642762 RepID=UPI0011DFDC89|nr:response regulator transcription factor [Nocardioides rubriscoriae]